MAKPTQQPSVSSMSLFTSLLGEIPQDTENRVLVRRKAEMRRLKKPQVKARGVTVSHFGVSFSEIPYLGRKGDWAGETPGSPTSQWCSNQLTASTLS